MNINYIKSPSEKSHWLSEASRRREFIEDCSRVGLAVLFVTVSLSLLVQVVYGII